MDDNDFVRVVEFRNSPKVDDTDTNFELNFPRNDCRDRIYDGSHSNNFNSLCTIDLS